MSIRYRDRHITCDTDGITIGRYYFPTGDKRVLYEDIRSVSLHRMSALRGHYRIWGSGDFRHWFHLDADRPNKSVAFILDLGSWWRPVITPDDPEAVGAILAEKGLEPRGEGSPRNP